jgi:hypothetical protein
MRRFIITKMEKGKFQLLKNLLNKHEKIKSYSGFLVRKKCLRF